MISTLDEKFTQNNKQESNDNFEADDFVGTEWQPSDWETNAMIAKVSTYIIIFFEINVPM